MASGVAMGLGRRILAKPSMLRGGYDFGEKLFLLQSQGRNSRFVNGSGNN
jgi:hypothetical protein